MTIRNKSSYEDLVSRVGSNYEIDPEEPVTVKETVLAFIVVGIIVAILTVGWWAGVVADALIGLIEMVWQTN